MDIKLSISVLTKQITTIESRIEADQATLKECKKALKAFSKIQEQAEAVKMPIIDPEKIIKVPPVLTKEGQMPELEKKLV